MTNKIKQWFALTDKGARGILKASVIAFLNYLWNIMSIVVVMLFLDGVISGDVNSSLIIGLSAVTLILMYALNFWEYNNLYTVTDREAEELRVDIATRLRNLPLWYFSKHDLTDLSQTVMSDVERIEHAVSHAVSKTLGFVLFLPIFSILLIIGNWQLGRVILGVNLVAAVLLLLSKKMQVRQTTKYYKKLRENSEAFQEAIEMQQEIKSYGLGSKVKKSMYEQMDESEKIHLISEISQAIPLNISTVITNCSIGIIILVGSLLFVDGKINLLYLVGYVLGAIKIKEAVDGLLGNMAELFYIDARIERIKEIRETPTQEGDDKKLSSFDIKLDHVEFSYNDDEKVLKGISFSAEQGKVTALVGLSGCGKTSVLRLISRLYDCDSGKITIGGEDISKISTSSLFENVSVVFQDVTLFNNTVTENIRIGNMNATDEEVKKAAALAGCEDFIGNMEKGYETMIGENGASLSGGERQRLSIARAILKDAPIIILDEISSSLDVENEKIIQDSLNTLIENKTVIIISHRLKSIENANKIVVLNDGYVEMAGSHKELLAGSETYKLLVENSKLIDEFRYGC